MAHFQYRTMKKFIPILMIACLVTYCSVADLDPQLISQDLSLQVNPFENVDTIRVLIAGQSNALANQCANTGGLIVCSDSVQSWSGINPTGWRTAVVGTSPNYANCGSISMAFCKKISEEYNKPVRFVKVAIGNQNIERWLPPINTNMIGTDAAILRSGFFNEQVNIIIWHQGENNHDAMIGVCNNNICYEQKLNELIAIFRSKQWFGSEGYFIAGGLMDGASNDRNAVIYKLNDNYSDRNSAAKSKGLTGCDNVHFNGISSKIMGEQRYFEALQNLLNN